MGSTDMTALHAVLTADVEREALKKQEAELLAKEDKTPEEETRLLEIYADLEEIEADKAESRYGYLVHP
ncbi:hypothetical protein SARC_17371 [Sphaeroforma arctica JP610]|uniref:Uncharacterized protein n=1 Tax=Sphaeroforma arctica JP610 TaxID=667725 RepID=A0A0L0F0D9_9EUKA|nr:hypothetical protein SARC_17371 [Sphaeroforma arctica JP610]KNC70106.1 hypothetical protein SARC_17371 [Sphaeroforma arctica JP610]|eukprot:XP_014144008.1 hypothetical protein SARC_17371 [Sphaeroforma arctica JP610]